MKQWYYSRQPQERLVLVLSAVILVGLLIYSLFWVPFTQEIAQKNKNVAEQQKTLEWMKETAAEVNHLKGSTGNQPTTGSREALLTTVDRTAKQIQLRTAIKRIKPDGNDKVQLWLEQAPFDRMVVWLDSLQNQNAITVDHITIDKQGASGEINARINLSKAAL